ncbi:MAG: hypothetical protein FJ388_14370, partial [Verrucomicrobia bacterium]|nr:hypothetical protein [Verrucomicrobiota bacterium]
MHSTTTAMQPLNRHRSVSREESEFLSLLHPFRLINKPMILSGLLLLAFVAHAVSPPLAFALPAFPGAEGFGADTPGGRGGKVYEVTNLKNAGPRSFRAAVEASGPRIVVFRVGGIIDVEHPFIQISNPYITIVGQ